MTPGYPGTPDPSQTPFRQWKKAVIAARIADCPGLPMREIRESFTEDLLTVWLREIQRSSRDTVIPLAVGRSLVALIGRSEAIRLTCHVANYPGCLPMPGYSWKGAR